MSETTGQKKIEHDLALIEASLYVSGRPLDLKVLASIIKTRSQKKTQKLVRSLVKRYERNSSALEILELEGNRFVLQLKKEYTPRVRRLSIRPLLRAAALKTLSYIAYRQPVLQSHVIEVRGRHAYKHLEQIENIGLISREKDGRTKIIKTTNLFADYFGLSYDLRKMKRQLKSKFQEELKLTKTK